MVEPGALFLVRILFSWACREKGGFYFSEQEVLPIVCWRFDSFLGILQLFYGLFICKCL